MNLCTPVWSFYVGILAIVLQTSTPGQLVIDHLNEQDRFGDHFTVLHEIESSIRTEQERLSNAGQGTAAGMTQAQTTLFLDRLQALESRAERTQRQLVCCNLFQC